MKSILLSVVTAIFLFSCSTPKPIDEITIEGNIKNLQDGKIYLAHATSWINLDSTVSENGSFTFKVKLDSGYTPAKVALQYKPKGEVDSFKKQIMQLGYLRISYRNHMKGADSVRYGATSFMLDKELIRVNGDMKDSYDARIFAGEDTDLMFEDWNGEFGWLGSLEGESRTAKLKATERKVLAHPSSYYLLNMIYMSKEQFAEKELEDILSSFDKELQLSIPGGKIKSYLANRTNPSLPYKNFQLADSENRSGWIYDKRAKVNMLVFWASWCRPCREEIPALKEIYKKHDGGGLNLVSISIDKQPKDWHKALGQEKMGWPQLIVEKDKIEEVQQKFNFSSIPLIVLIDSQGKEIKRFIGNGEENIKSIKEILSNNFKKQI